MKCKAIFLDRDGTINIDKSYIYKTTDFEFIPGAIEALKILQNEGFRLIIITNQSGIARGYYTENDLKKLNNWMLNQLYDEGINISKVYYCPHCKDGIVNQYNVECNCRKPKLGLFLEAIKEFNIDIENSYAIGDKIRDCEIAFKMNCKGYLIGHNEKKEIIQDIKENKYNNIFYKESLIDCANEIVIKERE